MSAKLLLKISFLLTLAAPAQDREKNTIILTETGTKNLGIQTALAEEINFESTLFAIGEITELPTNHAVVSTRIPGRVVDLRFIAGDRVEKGELVVKIESRQPGNPPPIISLTAPASGIVAKSHIRLGEPVEPSAELMDILDLSQVWAVAKVPQSEAGKLKPGSLARIRVAALEDRTFKGKLIRFGTTADRASGTLDAIFLLENEENLLRPGMRAEFSIVTASRPDVLAIPRTALQGDPTNRVVFIADFELDNAYLRSPVQVGQKNDTHIEIVSGVFPGDEVVTTGSYLLGFAGSGNGPSLKEALDAAHGHEHNPDGSEITDKPDAKHDDHDNHEEHRDQKTKNLIAGLAGTSLILAILLIIALQHISKTRKGQ